MFSVEYLTNLAERTGFRTEGLQKQMTLLSILRDINRHPKLKTAYALRGGTAINLMWFSLPRLSVDIDLNYIGSPDRDIMQKERPHLEAELKKLAEAMGITVQHTPDDYAGGKWRLRVPNVFGGTFTLELDLNYIMRVPVWDTVYKKPYNLDEDYIFDCLTVSFEELFAGKIKALLDRSAGRDLYDAWKLSERTIEFDREKLKKNLLLFGLTIDTDWRKKDLKTIDQIDQQMLTGQLLPLVKDSDEIDLKTMKNAAKDLLAPMLKYDDTERMFMDRFYNEGKYEPELIFSDDGQIERLKNHPALLWKLQNHRKHLGI